VIQEGEERLDLLIEPCGSPESNDVSPEALVGLCAQLKDLPLIVVLPVFQKKTPQKKTAFEETLARFLAMHAWRCYQNEESLQDWFVAKMLPELGASMPWLFAESQRLRVIQKVYEILTSMEAFKLSSSSSTLSEII
jgi:hypothetical protein